MKTFPISKALMLTAALAVSWLHWHPAQAQDKEKSKVAEPANTPKELAIARDVAHVAERVGRGIAQTMRQLDLLEKRVESARKVWKGKLAADRFNGNGQYLEWPIWSRRILDAELALHSAMDRPDADARLKSYREHLDRVRQIEKFLEQSFMAGKVSSLDVEEATYHRLDAEILLVQAGGKLP